MCRIPEIFSFHRKTAEIEKSDQIQLALNKRGDDRVIDACKLDKTPFDVKRQHNKPSNRFPNKNNTLMTLLSTKRMALAANVGGNSRPFDTDHR